MNLSKIYVVFFFFLMILFSCKDMGKGNFTSRLIVFFSFFLFDADGSGHPINAKPKVCPMCKGIGRVSAYLYTHTQYIL